MLTGFQRTIKKYHFLSTAPQRKLKIQNKVSSSNKMLRTTLKFLWNILKVYRMTSKQVITWQLDMKAVALLHPSQYYFDTPISVEKILFDIVSYLHNCKSFTTFLLNIFVTDFLGVLYYSVLFWKIRLIPMRNRVSYIRFFFLKYALKAEGHNQYIWIILNWGAITTKSKRFIYFYRSYWPNEISFG